MLSQHSFHEKEKGKIETRSYIHTSPAIDLAETFRPSFTYLPPLSPHVQNSQIIDDDYHHSLIVYHDTLTNGIRLHAAVWEGELRQCPVWTVFVTHPCPLTGGNKNLLSSSTTTTRRRGGHGGNKDDDGGDDDDNSAGGGGGGGGVSWLEPRGRHIVWLHGIQLYVFCDKYREANMRRNRKRAFEIYFVGEQGEFLMIVIILFSFFSPSSSFFSLSLFLFLFLLPIFVLRTTHASTPLLYKSLPRYPFYLCSAFLHSIPYQIEYISVIIPIYTHTHTDTHIKADSRGDAFIPTTTAAARFREVFYPPASEPPSDPEREDHEEEDEEEEEGGEEEKKEPERITGTSSPSLLSES